MSSYLLLLADESGTAVKVEKVSAANGKPELELSRLTVGRVSVNDELGGDLIFSAKQGATAALRLLFREFGHILPIARLEIETEALSATVTGRSAELLFGLELFLHRSYRERPTGQQIAAFAATGRLDLEGNVGAVEGIPAKITAAIESDLASGSFVFYPRDNDGEISTYLRERCRARGLMLKPVHQLEEAFIALGITIKGRWVGTPYRSLDAFERQHSRIFFGRQVDIQKFVGQLETRAAAGRPGGLIIGGSGSGKSSFCMAGVLPALERQSPSLEHAVWRPRDVLAWRDGEEISEAAIVRSVIARWRLRDAKNGAGFSFAETLSETDRLADLAEALPASALAAHRHVWIIDQFEELFTLGFSEQRQIAFGRFLAALQASGVWIIATLRNEFFNRYQELHDGDVAVLKAVFGTEGQFDLDRMGRDALRQVIVLPAELAGLQFETRASDAVRLDDVILADALVIADVLPLLEFTLQLLFDEMEPSAPQDDPARPHPRMLSFAAYERIGGIEGAIAKIVEPAFAALAADTRAALPGLLDALAVPAADGQRETARPAPLAQWPAGSPTRALVDALDNIRVLVTESNGQPGAGAQVRVAHEALFSHWPKAAAILKESRETRRQIEDFRQRADLWEKEGRLVSRLLAAPKDIENAKAVLPGTSDSSAYTSINRFIQASIEAEEQRLAAAAAAAQRQLRNRNRVIAAAIAAILILGALAVWAVSQRNEALFQRSRAIAQVAEQTIEGGDVMKGVLIALSQVSQDEELSGDIESALLHGMLINREAAVLQGFRGSVNSAAFSSDGQRIVTASEDNTARVWTLAGGRWSSVVLAGHESTVNSAVFSPDGQRIVTASYDQTARVWTLAGGRWSPVALEGHRDNVINAVFSPDGNRIITVSWDKTARVWTLAGGRWSWVALKGHSSFINSAVFSSDSQYIATASRDGTARVWTLAGGRWSSVALEGHSDAVNGVAFSPNGQRIATTSDDATVRVWTIDGGRWSSAILEENSRFIYSAKFSRDGHTIVTVSDDTAFRVWTLAGERWSSVTVKGHSRMVNSAEFSPDGQRIVTASSDNTARIWSVANLRLLPLPLEGHTTDVTNADFSPDGRHIVTTSQDNTARVWTLVGERWLSSSLKGHSDTVNSAMFSPDGKRIVTASRDNTARVWTLAGGRWPSVALKGHSGSVNGAMFSPDGQHIVTASRDNTARVWTLASGRWAPVALEGHNNSIISAVFNPDGRRILTASHDGTARLWSLAEGRWSSVVLNGYGNELKGAVFSPNGQHIAATSENGIVLVWSFAGDGWSSAVLDGHSDAVRSAEFSPDSQRIVTGSDDDTARVWTKVKGHWSSVVLEGHNGSVTSAMFSQSGKRIVTRSSDDTARIWTAAGNRWSSVVLEGVKIPVKVAIFSPDGQHIVMTSASNTAWVYPTPSGSTLVEIARQSLTRCLSSDDLMSLGLSDSFTSDSTGLRQPPCN